VPALFALDQNFPQPIMEGLRDWLEADAELTPIADIHPDMATLDDWELLLALYTDGRAWDGLITTDASMVNLPRELSVLCQTKLTLVVAMAAGHDPIKATGLVLAHISNVGQRTRPDRAQVWRLRTQAREAEDPWTHLDRAARRRGETANEAFARERLSKSDLSRSPLAGPR
jgi:hypothetical protein